MILGFTGTRTPITLQQLPQLNLYFFGHDIQELHHGACVNADEESHKAALWFNIPRIIVHPPTNGRWMMAPDWNHDNVTVLPHKPYHPRNMDIVNTSNQLLAIPNSPRRPHSGTWDTIDYALKRHVPVDIIWPDGRLEVGYDPHRT